MRRSRNPVGDFNTRGMEKCPYCGGYEPTARINSHMDSCVKNPVNKEVDD